MGGNHEVLSITPFHGILHSRHVGHDSFCAGLQHTCATRLRAAQLRQRVLQGLLEVLAMKHSPLGH